MLQQQHPISSCQIAVTNFEICLAYRSHNPVCLAAIHIASVIQSMFVVSVPILGNGQGRKACLFGFLTGNRNNHDDFHVRA